MENYIVRIYRRDSDDPQKIAGMVENVTKRENATFKSSEELMHILVMPPQKAGSKFRADERV